MIPRFSVVIATRGRPVQLARCMSAIAAVRFPRDRFEVIVVNDGGEVVSEEQLTELAGGATVRLISQPRRGPGAARNAGSAIADGEFLAFIDDDCIPPVDWLDNLDVATRVAPQAIIGGRTLNGLPANTWSETSETLVAYVCSYYNDPEERRSRFFASNNMTIGADQYRSIGGFDESFLQAEDRELCKRWDASGRDFHFSPKVIMYHAHALSPFSFWRQHFGYGRGAFPYRKKNSADEGQRIKVEPRQFYTGMLRFPFRTHVRRPATVSSLIVLAQIANAAGFAYESMAHLIGRKPRPVYRPESEPA